MTHGGIMLLSASPKVGKSLFGLEIGLSVAAGRTPFGFKQLWVPETARVLLVDYELGEKGLQERAAKVVRSDEWPLLDQNFRCVSKDDENYNVPSMVLSEPAGFKELYRVVDDTQPNVLIIDTLRRAIGSYEETSNADMGQVTMKLDRLVRDFRENNLSVIVIHHNKKKPGVQYQMNWDPLDPENMSGAGSLFGNPDALMMLHTDPEDDRFNAAGQRMWKVKSRIRLRHGEDPGDMFFEVNRDNDLGVKFVGLVQERPRTLAGSASKLEPVKGEQMKLLTMPSVGGGGKPMFQAPG